MEVYQSIKDEIIGKDMAHILRIDGDTDNIHRYIKTDFLFILLFMTISTDMHRQDKIRNQNPVCAQIRSSVISCRIPFDRTDISGQGANRKPNKKRMKAHATICISPFMLPTSAVDWQVA